MTDLGYSTAQEPAVAGVVRRAWLPEQFLAYLIMAFILYFSNSREASFEDEFLCAGMESSLDLGCSGELLKTERVYYHRIE